MGWRGSRRDVVFLVRAAHDDGQRVIGTTASITKSAADLRKRLTPLIRKTQPYTKRIARRTIWVEPQLLGDIEHRAKSEEGKVRHPFYLGLREDI